MWGGLEGFLNLGVDIRAAHSGPALFLGGRLKPHLDPQLLADVLNLRVDLGDFRLIPLPLRHQGGQVIPGNEGKLGLKFALLVFNDFVDVDHGEVVDVLKSGNQAAEYSVEFSFQLLSFSPAADEVEQSAPKVGVVEVGEGVFKLDFVFSSGFSNLGGGGHWLFYSSNEFFRFSYGNTNLFS